MTGDAERQGVMGSGDAVATRATRGRIVVLVDNAVNGDSRVQKIAASAARAGWDVTLLGCSFDGTTQTWSLGLATVRLLAMPDPLAGRRNAIRRVVLRCLGVGQPVRPVVGQSSADSRPPGSTTSERPSGRAPGERPPATGGGGVPRRVRRALLTAIRRVRRALSAAIRRVRPALHTAIRGARRPWDRASVWFWLRVMGDRAWRRLEPGLWDFERVYGPVIDELAPDLIHANDFRMLGVGARAKMRATAAGRSLRLVWDAHEYLPGIKPWHNNARWLPAHRAHEREYAPHADAVVTVSPALAELLRREHGLAELPDVVMNAPICALTVEERAQEVPDLRAMCGIGPDIPLLVYCGGITPVRGVDLVIDTLADLPGMHVALVSLRPNGKNAAADQMRARAESLGVADRVHLLRYVPHWQVSRFISCADAATSPLHHLPNHEIALSNKFFEYSHARLPVVVSDVRTMAETVRTTGQGEVFRAEDVADYVRAVKAVLADPRRYRAAYDKPGLLAGWTWEAQAEVLDGVYRRLLAQPDLHPHAPKASSAGVTL